MRPRSLYTESTRSLRLGQGWLRATLATLAYGVLTVVTTYPLWLNLAGTLPGDIGDPMLNTWIIAWDIHALQQSPLSVFDANIFFPNTNTLAYSEHLLGTALLVWPVYILSGEPVLAYNAAFLSSFVLSGLAMFLLVRRFTGNDLAAFLAGLAFAFAPYRFASIGHLHLLTTQWLPLTILFLDRYAEDSRRSDLGLFALFFLLQLLTSWHVGLFTGAVVVAYLIYRGLWSRDISRRHLLSIGGACLVVVALNLPLMIPYITVGELQEQRPSSASLAYSAQLGDFLAAAPGNRLYGDLTAGLRSRAGFNVENQLFLGVATLFLAVCSLTSLWRAPTLAIRRSVVMHWLLALLAIALSLGPLITIGEQSITTPYGLAQAAIPQLSLMRVPARWVVVLTFALAILIGYGVVTLLRATRARWGWPATALTAMGLASALLADSWTVPLPTVHTEPLGSLSGVYQWLAQEPGDFAIVEIPIYAWPDPQYEEGKRMYSSTLHWKKLVNGNSGLNPANYVRTAQRLRDFPSAEALGELVQLGQKGVRYVIVHPSDPEFDQLRWKSEGIRQAARSGILFPRYADDETQVYEINPYGASLFTSLESLTDPRWQALARQRVGATFGGQITLLGYDSRVEGENLVVTLYWMGKTPRADYTVFVHLLDKNQRLIAQADSPPDEGQYPTSQWQEGELIRDVHRLPLNREQMRTQQGNTLFVGLYSLATMERLSVTDPISPTAEGVFLSLGGER